MAVNNKNKEISFVIYSPFPNYSGGRETWLFNMIKRLVKMNYSITIYTFKDESYYQFFNLEKLENVKLKKCATLESFKISRLFSRSYLRIMNLLVFDIQVFLRALFSNETCFVSLGPITESLPICWLKSIKPNIKYICSVRGLHALMLTQTYPAFESAWNFLEKYTFKKSDTIMCNGYDTLDYVKSLGFSAKLMPNGVDFMHFKNSYEEKEDSLSLMANSDTFYITSTATIQDIKGIPALIKAMKILNNDYDCPNYKVIWVGKGDSSIYDQDLQKNQVRNNIVFTGERKNTVEFLKKADVVLCLSGGGGMSMALLEAMASGCIIIAWNTPIYTQLLEENISAILVEENNYMQLAEKIKYVMDNKNNLIGLGIEAQKKSKVYDWENLVNRLIEIMEEKNDETFDVFSKY